MPPRYAKPYIDRLYADEDVFALWGVVDVISKQRELPEQFWLFSRLLEWCGSTRSGIWQYYEGISAGEFERIAGALERHGLQEVAERYRSGMSSWKEPQFSTELDHWIDAREHELHAAAFRLISDRQDCLYG